MLSLLWLSHTERGPRFVFSWRLQPLHRARTASRTGEQGIVGRPFLIGSCPSWVAEQLIELGYAVLRFIMSAASAILSRICFGPFLPCMKAKLWHHRTTKDARHNKIFHAGLMHRSTSEPWA